MQNVKFRDIDEFFQFLPPEELRIVEALRSLVFNCIPDVKEKLSYNVPYYRRHKNICFIWPASILWGKRKTYEVVRFGFTYGYLLTDEINFLSKGSRKLVYWHDFTGLKPSEMDILKAFIFEAVEVDKEISGNTKI